MYDIQSPRNSKLNAADFIISSTIFSGIKGKVLYRVGNMQAGTSVVQIQWWEMGRSWRMHYISHLLISSSLACSARHKYSCFY